jgi:hypothetical protein
MDAGLHRTAYGTNPHSRGGGRADEISRIAESAFGMRGGRVEFPADTGLLFSYGFGTSADPTSLVGRFEASGQRLDTSSGKGKSSKKSSK